MDGIHTEFLQVVDSFRLRKCQEFSFVFQPRRGVDGEIAMVHLIDDEVGR